MGLCLGSPAHYGPETIYLGASGSSDPNRQIIETQNYLKEYSFADLKSATKNFKSDNLMGKGRFGTVFNGWMDKKTLAPSKVAIKKLNPASIEYLQEEQIELNVLGRLSHPNLVNLLGYCWEDKEVFLVYEFMQKGNLENHLFRNNSNINTLSWDKRIKIAIGVARGLAFLHGLENQVFYGEFRASNVLLDENYNAKITDFGFAKLGKKFTIVDFSSYVDPEFFQTGYLSSKSDVYSFGVLLFEFLTGLRALDSKNPMKQKDLTNWLKSCLSNERKLKAMMDKRMDDKYPYVTAFYVAQLTLKCLDENSRNRPSMNDAVEVLELIDRINGRKPK